MKRKIVLSAASAVLLCAATAWSGEAAGPLSSYQPQLSDSFKQLVKEADIAAGENTFMRKCSSCHDYKKTGGHGKGPHLWNVFGRKAGAIAGFEFSDAMRSSGHTWDLATLNYYLTNTENAVPGRIMDFRGIRRDKQRAQLLAFMMQYNDNPPALPE
jgi:cytochrome c